MLNAYKISKLAILFLFFTACVKNNTIDNTFPIDYTIPEERSFYMGFTAFPYDLSMDALNQSYANQVQNGDLLLTHFDHGVPWNEALNGLPFPSQVQEDIDRAVENKTPYHKILLTATPTNSSRDQLAGYWNNNGSHQPLPPPWNSYTFKTPEVISAYTNYCKRIIDAIQPNYFAYGIEINASFLENTSAYDNFMILAQQVYDTLKHDYPNLPIFLTFQDQSFNKDKKELANITKMMMDYSDIMAVSTYPYWQYNYPKRDANPTLFPNNWLQEMKNIAPNKPFAISETGYCAENLILNEYGVKIVGTEKWQADYTQKLFIEAQKLNAMFIAWFIYRDYDHLYQKIPSTTLKIWKDTGLEDENGTLRPAHIVWDEWRNLLLNH